MDAQERDELVATFLSRLPDELRDGAAVAELAGELADVIARARAGAPGVDLDTTGFVVHLAERAAFDRRGRAQLPALRASELWIAYGCVIGNGAALALFEATYAPDIKTALARSFDRDVADDAELKLRERLFLVAADDVPRLASYAGRGDLRAWLRAAAVRTGIDVMRGRRDVPVDPAALGEVGARVDPMLAELKRRYRDEFRVAFAEAAAALTDRERTLLRYRFFDELSLDQIATLYRVHRVTAARWLSAIRESLFEGTRAALMARLAISESEVDSVLRLIDSELDASIEELR